MRKKTVLKKSVIDFLKQYRNNLFVVVLLSQLTIGLLIYFLFGRITPNDNIFVPKGGSVAFLMNENPKFSVGFGKVNEPAQQWVRFESSTSKNNPFEKDNGNLFTQIAKVFQKQEKYGIEMSLVGVDLSETKGIDFSEYGQEVKTVGDILGTDKVETSTELIDIGREIGNYSDDQNISKQTVLNKEVADGVDLEYQILKGLGLKEEIIIRDLEAYKESCKDSDCKLPLNRFEFDLKMDNGVELRDGWFTIEGKSTQTYYFVDSKGRYLAHFLPNFAVDGQKNKTYDVNLNVEKGEGGNYRAIVTVDLAWLLSSERVFPIRIDPSIVHDDTGDFSGGVFDRTESVAGPKIQLDSSSSGEYISNSLDMASSMSSATLSWIPSGVNTGNGETPYSTTGLVAQWNLNETSGTTAVSGGSCGTSCNGTLTNMTTTGQDAAAGTGWTSDNRRWGAGALMFDGSNDYVTTSALDSTGYTEMSVETWVKTNSTAASTMVVQWKGLMLYLNRFTTGKVFIGFDDVSTNNSSANESLTLINNDQWHYIVGTNNGTTTNIYIDGVLENTYADTLSTGSQAIILGSNAGTMSYYRGIVDSTRIYNRVLLPSEILSNYQAGNIEFQYRVSTDNSTWSNWTSYDDGASDASWESFDEYEREIVIQKSMVSGTSNLTNFPLYLSVTDNSLKTTSNGGFVGQTDGGDIRFEDSSGNKLSHEIETYSPTTGLLVAWVKIPTLRYDLDTTIRMKYGNVSVADQWNITDVWDSNYVGVWHMNQSSGTLLDSTSNGNNLSLVNGTPDYAQVGKLGYAINFTNASSEYFSLTDGTLANQPTGSTAFTTQTWFSATAASNTNGFVMWGTCSSGGVNAFRRNGDGYRHYFWANDYDKTTSTSADTWYMAAVTYNGTSRSIYHEGASLGFQNPSAPNVTSGGFALGKTCGTEYWDGKLDEIRISKIARTADWIKTEYNNQNSSTYIVYGTEKKYDSVVKTEGSASMQYPQARLVVDANTVALWHLDERGGSGAYIKDSSGNGNHGTPSGTTYSNAGKLGGMRTFASGDDISLGNISITDSAANITVDAWVYPTEQTAATAYRAFSEGYVLSVGQYGSQAAFYMGNGSSWTTSETAGGSLTINSWNYVTYVKSGTSASIYINGVLSKSGITAPATLGTSSSTNYISTYNGGSNAWIGGLDEIRVSNIARTADEIAESYKLGKDSYINQTLNTTDLSTKNTISVNVASDRPGSYLSAIWGESAFANYQPDANTVGLWHLYNGGNSSTYIDESKEENSGITSFYGISYGFLSSNLTMIMNQWNGSSNNYEMDITCPGGDANCQIVTLDGAVLSPTNIAYGVAAQDIASDLFIMYSPSLSGQSITGYANNSNNFIAVRYNSGWQYDNNSTWVSFTPQTYNILVAKASWGTSITQLDYPAPADGKIGVGANFSGSDQITVLDDNSLDISSSFTVEAWIKPDSLPSVSNSGGGIVTKGGAGDASADNHNYWLSLCYNATWAGSTGAGYSIGFENSAGTNYYATMDESLTVGSWHHLVGVFDDDENELRLYHNGQLVKVTTSITAVPNTQTIDLTIGGMTLSDHVGYFDGVIDEVRISSIARTAEEIRQAYELDLRTHPVQIDFGAFLVSGNLITGSGDTSFSIDATVYGLADLGSEVYPGDKIIVKENYDGTEYVAQGSVATVDEDTGAVTVSSWDSGSTFPSGGYTVNADVFKWQTEYIPIKNRTIPTQVNAVNLLTFNITNGDEGRNIWIDDLRTSTGNLSTYTGETLTFPSSGQYLQYKAIFNTWDSNVTPYISQVQLDYTGDVGPTMDQIMRHGKWFNSSGQKQGFWWAKTQ